MIYFDNAATTKYKPEAVYEAANFYLREVGVSPGRGSYGVGIEASRMLYKSRCAVGKYFGMSRLDKVVFTKNSTEAMNLFFNGFLHQGDHVIISCYEHNAVLRPIHKLKEQGVIEYSIVKREDLELSARELFEKYAQENTRLLAMTLASNLTGRIIFREDVFCFFHKKGITTFIDSSQGAGKIRLSMKDQGIDFLAFTGHKDLMAIPGVGGLCCESSEHIEPFVQGGTGIHGEEYTNPDIFPEGYEAGTLNMPAIWSIHAAINYLTEHFDEISAREKCLMKYLLDGLKEIDSVTVYDEDNMRVSTCSINVEGTSSDKLVALFDKNGVCVRGGIHCAIIAHEAIGTVSTGTVRLSLNYMNTEQEIDTVLDILRNVGE
jgi:cysteine desulfurase family protein